MKDIRKQVLIATLLLVYGLGFGLLLAGSALPKGGGHDEAHASYFVAGSPSNIGFHIPQSESSVSSSAHVPILLIKEGKFVAGLLPLFDAATAHAFKQLVHASQGLLLSLRKSDLLFPAHFFW